MGGSRVVVVVCVVMAVALAGACGGGGDDEPSAFDVPEWLLDLDPDANRVTWVGLPAEQKELLTDGGLRFDEYAQAIRATAGCVSEHGHTVASPTADASGVRLSWPATPAAGAQAAQYYDEVVGCVDRHSHYIQYLWGLLEPPSEGEIAAARARVDECMADAGAGLPTSADLAAWLRAGREAEGNQFERCTIDAAMATGINVFYVPSP